MSLKLVHNVFHSSPFMIGLASLVLLLEASIHLSLNFSNFSFIDANFFIQFALAFWTFSKSGLDQSGFSIASIAFVRASFIICCKSSIFLLFSTMVTKSVGNNMLPYFKIAVFISFHAMPVANGSFSPSISTVESYCPPDFPVLQSFQLVNIAL